MSKASNPKWLSTLCVSAVALLAGGCQSATAPEPVDGVFVLRTVGANPIPAVTGIVLDTEYSVLADTVSLRADGSGEWTSTTSRRNLGTGVSDTTRTMKQFSHRRSGAAVVMTSITCEPFCEVVPNEAMFHYEGSWLARGLGPATQRYERLALPITL